MSFLLAQFFFFLFRVGRWYLGILRSLKIWLWFQGPNNKPPQNLVVVPETQQLAKYLLKNSLSLVMPGAGVFLLHNVKT